MCGLCLYSNTRKSPNKVIRKFVYDQLQGSQSVASHSVHRLFSNAKPRSRIESLLSQSLGKYVQRSYIHTACIPHSNYRGTEASDRNSTLYIALLCICRTAAALGSYADQAGASAACLPIISCESCVVVCNFRYHKTASSGVVPSVDVPVLWYVTTIVFRTKWSAEPDIGHENESERQCGAQFPLQRKVKH